MKKDDYEPYDPVRFRLRQEQWLAAAPGRLGLSSEIIEKIRRCRYNRIMVFCGSVGRSVGRGAVT